VPEKAALAEIPAEYDDSRAAKGAEAPVPSVLWKQGLVAATFE
jgi:hypothetical protein